MKNETIIKIFFFEMNIHEMLESNKELTQLKPGEANSNIYTRKP